MGMITAMGKQPGFTDQLRQAIERSGFSQYHLAKLSRIDQSQLSKFMHAKRGLSIEGIEKICELIGAVGGRCQAGDAETYYERRVSMATVFKRGGKSNRVVIGTSSGGMKTESGEPSAAKQPTRPRRNGWPPSTKRMLPPDGPVSLTPRWSNSPSKPAGRSLNTLQNSKLNCVLD